MGTSFLTTMRERGGCQWTRKGPLPIFKAFSMARGMECTHWLDLGHILAGGSLLKDNQGQHKKEKLMLNKQKQVLFTTMKL